jgi:hypothetical protein
MQRTGSALIVALCAVFAVATAQAATIQVTGESPLGELGVALNSGESGEFIENPDGTQNWSGEFLDPNGWEFSWDLLMDPDPFISGVVAVVNNTGIDASFTFQVSMPVSVSLPAGSPMSGSSSITINDANGNGSATLSAPAGGSIYEAGIESTVEATLFDDPYSLSPPFPPSTTSDNASFTGTTSTALNVGDEMFLTHSFVLSAGDSATGNSNFSVIPEPASLVLVVVAGLAAGVWRFRGRSHC